MGQFFNLDVCADSTDGSDDGGFPRVHGAAIPSFAFSFTGSMALLGLVAVSVSINGKTV